MTTKIRRTKAAKLSDVGESNFRYGAGRSSWRSNVDRGAFLKTRLELKRINDERSAKVEQSIDSGGTMSFSAMFGLHNVYLEGAVLNRICLDIMEAMPYLECYTDHSHRAYFFHKNTDFCVGYVTNRPGYCMKQYGLFSPLTSDKMRGGVSTDNRDKVLSMARKYFKYAPPKNMHPYLAWDQHYSELNESRRFFKGEVGEMTRALRKNFSLCKEASKESYNLFNDMFKNKPEFMVEKFPNIYKSYLDRDFNILEFNRTQKAIANVAYIMVDAAHEGKLQGKMVVIAREAKQYVDGETSLDDCDLTRVDGNYIPAPTPCEIPPELVVGIAQLNMDDPCSNGEYEFQKDVGQRISTNEYLMYYKVPVADMPHDITIYHASNRTGEQF